MHGRRLPHGMRLVALLALIAAVVLAIAGCGSASSGSASTGPSPATVVPADAIAYVQATVRPSGAAKDDLEAAARKVLHTQDPSAKAEQLIDDALAGSGLPGSFTYARDVEPWLGDRVAFYVRIDARSAGPDAGLVVAVTDRDALEQELQRLRDAGELRRGGVVEGVPFDVSSEETVGIVDDFLVVADSREGFRAAIDAARGEGLADVARFSDELDRVPDDALAFFWGDPRALAAAQSLGETFSRAVRGGASIASLTANADEIALEISGPSGLLDDDSSDAEVTVGQLPGDAWLALATPPLGPLIKTVLDSAGVHDQAAQEAGFALGLDLDRDLLDPLGGLGLFVRGGSLLDIGGGVLLQMTDAASAQRLLTRIEAIVRAGSGLPTRSLSIDGARGFEVQVPQSPQPIVVLAKDDRIAAGYAASSAQDLLEPQQRFDESSAGKAAIETLGEGYTPELVMIVPPLAGLLRSLDELQVADLSSVLPYVEAYRSLAAGTTRDGDRTTLRIVAALR